ncbi:hypothetical protein GQ600_27833 [Phytophthora cactorum]|nr:hypothetical protein GQ600_27833 [Phytophthora cactorum]
MDMLNGGEGLDTFCATLENISGKLEQTPRNFENVPLFSELAGFALQYSNDARRFVKTFAGMSGVGQKMPARSTRRNRRPVGLLKSAERNAYFMVSHCWPTVSGHGTTKQLKKFVN